MSNNSQNSNNTKSTQSNNLNDMNDEWDQAIVEQQIICLLQQYCDCQNAFLTTKIINDFNMTEEEAFKTIKKLRTELSVTCANVWPNITKDDIPLEKGPNVESTKESSINNGYDQEKLEQRIIFFLKNFSCTNEKIVYELVREFNITKDNALIITEKIRNKLHMQRVGEDWDRFADMLDEQSSDNDDECIDNNGNDNNDDSDDCWCNECMGMDNYENIPSHITVSDFIGNILESIMVRKADHIHENELVYNLRYTIMCLYFDPEKKYLLKEIRECEQYYVVLTTIEKFIKNIKYDNLTYIKRVELMNLIMDAARKINIV